MANGKFVFMIALAGVIGTVIFSKCVHNSRKNKKLEKKIYFDRDQLTIIVSYITLFDAINLILVSKQFNCIIKFHKIWLSGINKFPKILKYSESQENVVPWVKYNNLIKTYYQTYNEEYFPILYIESEALPKVENKIINGEIVIRYYMYNNVEYFNKSRYIYFRIMPKYSSTGVYYYMIFEGKIYNNLKRDELIVSITIGDSINLRTSIDEINKELIVKIKIFDLMKSWERTI